MCKVDNKCASDKKSSLARFVAIVLAIVGGVAVVFVGYAMLVMFFIPEEKKDRDGYDGFARRGQFGDMFGLLSAAFSGLALGGVIWAIHLQREELHRMDQAQNAAHEALRSQFEAMERATHAQLYCKVVDILQSKEIRDARSRIYSIGEKRLNDWSREDVEAGELICTSYDDVAIMIYNGMLPKRLLLDNWGNSLRRTWRILKPLVEDKRMRYEWAQFWDDYEKLAKEAQDLLSSPAPLLGNH